MGLLEDAKILAIPSNTDNIAGTQRTPVEDIIHGRTAYKPGEPVVYVEEEEDDITRDSNVLCNYHADHGCKLKPADTVLAHMQAKPGYRAQVKTGNVIGRTSRREQRAIKQAKARDVSVHAELEELRALKAELPVAVQPVMQQPVLRPVQPVLRPVAPVTEPAYLQKRKKFQLELAVGMFMLECIDIIENINGLQILLPLDGSTVFTPNAGTSLAVHYDGKAVKAFAPGIYMEIKELNLGILTLMKEG